MIAWIKVKIAVVPPIPKARVRMTADVKTGDSRNCLTLYRRVLSIFCIRASIEPDIPHVQKSSLRNTLLEQKGYESWASRLRTLKHILHIRSYAGVIRAWNPWARLRGIGSG